MTEVFLNASLKRATLFFGKETINTFQLYLSCHKYHSKGMQNLLDQNIYSGFFFT